MKLKNKTIMKMLISIQIILPGTILNCINITYGGKYLYVAVSEMISMPFAHGKSVFLFFNFTVLYQSYTRNMLMYEKS